MPSPELVRRMTQRKTNRELFDLKGRAALIIGAAGHLGPEYADGLSEAGADVVVTDVAERLPQCRELAKALQEKYGTTPLGLTVELFEKESIEAATAEIVRRYGKIDILINNAAYNPLTTETQAPFAVIPICL